MVREKLIDSIIMTIGMILLFIGGFILCPGSFTLSLTAGLILIPIIFIISWIILTIVSGITVAIITRKLNKGERNE